MSHPPVVIVDENDKVVGSEMLAVAWKKGLYHRIVRIMVEDENGRILLQRRSDKVDLFPNCWDHSAAGHVDAGEEYLAAAYRELQEELGIKNVQLEKVATYRTNSVVQGRILNRFNTLYCVHVSATAPLHVDPEEVHEARWFTLTEIRKLIHEHPEELTPDLGQVIREYYPA